MAAALRPHAVSVPTDCAPILVEGVIVLFAYRIRVSSRPGHDWKQLMGRRTFATCRPALVYVGASGEGRGPSGFKHLQ